MNEWIKTSDEVPERLRCVLGLRKDGCIYVVCQCDWDDVCDDWHYMPQPMKSHVAKFEDITHWMPLPNPPGSLP